MAADAGPIRGSLPVDTGRVAVQRARRALRASLMGQPSVEEPEPERSEAPGPDVFEAPRGVFVTWRRYPDRALRGCVGFPRAVYPLGTALAQAAVAAGREDPRFPPVGLAELDRLVVEVSILTEPVRLDEAQRERWPELVEVGRHGLVVEARDHGGLLLPQVAPEQGWDSRQLLAGTCEKAGLPRDAWRRPGVRVLTFEAIVFEEDRPGGEVHRSAG